MHRACSLSGFAAKSAGLVLCALSLTLPAQRAAAEMPGNIPANSSAAIWIDDTQEFWKKAATLPLTRAFRQFMDNPLLQQQMGFQMMRLDMDKVTAKLGYPATPDELLGTVFKSLTFYSAPDAAGGEPMSALSLAVADEVKAKKLFEVLDASLREDAQTTGGLPAEITFSEETIAGSSLTRFSGKEEGYYGLVDGKQFLIANTAAAAQQAVGAFKGEKSDAVNADFERLSKAVSTDDADIAMWVDTDSLAGIGNMAGPLGTIPSNKLLFSMKVTPTGLEGRAANTADPAALSPNIKPGALQALSFLSSQPLAGFASHQFDAEYMFETFDQLSATSGMQAGGTVSPRAMFEAATGISVDQELIPALGNEVGVGLNAISPNPDMPMIPLVDVVIGARVKDAAKMTGVMQKLEKFIEAGAASQSQAQGTMPQTFASGEAGIRSFAAAPGMGLSYLIQGDYLLLGLNDPSVKGALARKAAPATSLQESAQVKDVMKPLNATEYYDAGMINISKIVNEVVVPYMPLMAGGAGGTPEFQIAMAFVRDVLSHVGTLSAASTRQDNLAVGQIKLVMQ